MKCVQTSIFIFGYMFMENNPCRINSHSMNVNSTKICPQKFNNIIKLILGGQLKAGTKNIDREDQFDKNC